MTDLTNSEAQQKVWELIKDIRIPLLVTHSTDGLMEARPMSHLNSDFNGVLWFFTSSDSPKIKEIKNNPNILLSYSNPTKQEYVSIQGMAKISDDRAKIEQLWSEPARIWFPKGKADSSIRVIEVEVLQAQYWESPAAAFQMIYGYAKARLTGDVPQIGENRKVAF